MIRPERCCDERMQALKWIGVGLQASHYGEWMALPRSAGWLEVHSENYLGDGGLDLHVLQELAHHYPISLHGVGAALGSVEPLCESHLASVRRLCDRIKPVRVSEHLSWSRVGGEHFNELLPVPCTREALHQVCTQVERMQEALGRKILVENVCSYVRYREAHMHAADFMNQVAETTECGLLIDLHNLYVDQRNHGLDPYAFLHRINPAFVGELHLAGSSSEGSIMIDDHGAEVPAPVWALYTHALRRWGAVPTLVEWDDNLPSLEVFLGQAEIAAALFVEAVEPDHVYA
ncbi:MNIO family bufferin maturase [Xanthomonas axonopodis]